MGGSSKSKRSTSVDNSQEVRDFSGVQAEQVVGGNLDQSTTIKARDLTMTDFGAVEAAFAFGDSAGARASELQKSAVDQVANIGATQVSLARDVNRQIGDLADRFAAGDDDRNRKMMLIIAALVVLGFIGVAVANSWGKRK